MFVRNHGRSLRYVGGSFANGWERFIPPVLDKEKSNIENSENTALFKISTFQYIYAGIVLSVGPPFRQPMRYNCKLPMLKESTLTLL